MNPSDQSSTSVTNDPFTQLALENMNCHQLMQFIRLSHDIREAQKGGFGGLEHSLRAELGRLIFSALSPLNAK